MPIRPVVIDQPIQDQQQGQVKFCSTCHLALVDPTSPLYHSEASAVCAGCREHNSSPRPTLIPTENRPFCVELDNDFIRQASHEGGNTLQSTRRIPDDHAFDEDTDMGSPTSPESDHPFHGSFVSPQSYPNKHIPLTIQINNNSNPSAAYTQNHTITLIHPPNIPRRHNYPASSPDPLVDITRLRIRSQGHHCLYPGASFQGTQKSGRNSYDVNVTIVDVDFASSFLCGYLRIKGLTDDWPELTTYFDAEIIGSRHGFLTQNWGANESEDMVHWSRFPAFRHVKHELKKPHLTMSDRDRGAVFMRWKERFLVPDHRVQDINGASFAGFYYVCVDFNPTPASAARSTSQHMPLTPESDDLVSPVAPSHSQLSSTNVIKPEHPQRARRDSSIRRGGRGSSLGPRSSVPVATMSGFYFHQNSEPYQQLSLCHVPERTSSSFEFR